MKKLLPLAIAAAMAAPATAMADATVYGKIHAAYDFTDSQISWDDQNDEIDWFSFDDSVANLNSHNSRVGIKGSEDLGNGLKAIYQLEFAVDIAEDGEGGLLKGRNQFVGLAGGFGTVLVGRHDTPLKMSQGKFDVFNDTYADMKRVVPGEDRLGNVGAYVSPDFAGFTFVGAMVAGEEGDANRAAALNVSPDLTGIADHYSLAGMYNNGPFYGALAYNGYDLGVYDANPSMWRATFVFKMDMFQVGALWSTTDYDTNNVSDSDVWGLSGAFTFAGAHTIKAQYLDGDNPVTGISDILSNGFSPNVAVPVPGDDQATQWTVGYDYSFSKRTTLYALYNNYEIDSISDEEGTFSLGMIHSF